MLGGATGWLNSEPLGPAELRGHAVLVNFWTLTCINWIRTAPFIRAWSRAYRDDGLVVIGVHTPEFSFEHDLDLVRHAVKDRAIEYPVAADNGYAVWRRSTTTTGRRSYFIDAEGAIRGQHFGEGRYPESERIIQQLLGIERDLVTVAGSGVEAAADWDHLLTPETYLGYARAEGAVSLNGTRNRPGHYAVPAHLPRNHWALEGEWTIGEEKVVLNQAGGGIAVRFHARDAHLVMSPTSANQCSSASFSTANRRDQRMETMSTRQATGSFGPGACTSCSVHTTRFVNTPCRSPSCSRPCRHTRSRSADGPAPCHRPRAAGLDRYGRRRTRVGV